MPPQKNKPTSAAPLLHNQLTLIEVAEPEILDALKMDRKIGPLLATRLSDCVVVVTPGNADTVIKHLRKAGHTPKILEVR
ncbi:MAG: hypothetical protein K1Y36_17635 [Blastocatellia bacterium]|nr:hypothetical protein [Blastocatellia bacterium]